MIALAGPHVDRAPVLADPSAPRLLPVATDLWRVTDRHGRVIGHLEARRDPRGLRYRARRFHAPSRAFRDLGEFWSADDAVACLRYSR